MKYFAFQLYDHADGAELHVDTDPAALWNALRRELNHARKYSIGIETLEVGQVEADSVEAALNEVRAERWLKGTHGYADGVTVEDEGDEDENVVEITSGTMEWDAGTIRYIDNDGNCEGKWEPGDDDYDQYKADYFPDHEIPTD